MYLAYVVGSNFGGLAGPVQEGRHTISSSMVQSKKNGIA
jgi:hypothetical protein